MSLLEPKEQVIKTQAGEKTFIFSKFPAVAGREIVAKYPLSNMPKVGEYAVSEEVMLKLMAFVAVPRDNGEPLRLTTKELVNNHVTDWEALARIEAGMLEYNCSFFANGAASTFLSGFAQNVKASISKIVTDSLAQLSQKEKQASGS